MNEVQEHLPVPLRAGHAGVYGRHGAPFPRERSLRDLPDDPPADIGVAHDAALADVSTPGLELRLHEHDRLPARLGKAEDGRQDLAE